jgi:hypothetical protein
MQLSTLLISTPVLIDLFIRLGYVTPENEADYLEIVTRLHGNFDWSRW